MLVGLGALQPPQESRMLLGVLQGSLGPKGKPRARKRRSGTMQFTTGSCALGGTDWYWIDGAVFHPGKSMC